MTTALASLASGRPVKSSVGMTGEVTLQGKVLPIGGVKQKLLAAHRAGLTDVIIPKRNEPDLDDLPESVRGELRIHPVADVADVLELALEPAAGRPSDDSSDLPTRRPTVRGAFWRIRAGLPDSWSRGTLRSEEKPDDQYDLARSEPLCATRWWARCSIPPTRATTRPARSGTPTSTAARR